MLEQMELINEYLPWFFPVVSFVLGACWGSFLNVCIYRIPAGKSVVHPGSHCYGCNKPIAFYDNLPILSWFILRGKARCCGAPFSVRYAAIEFLTGCLFLACYMLRGPEVAIPGFVFIAILICTIFMDLDHYKIWPVFTVGGFVAGCVLSLIFPALHAQGDAPLWFIGGMRALIIAMIGGFVGSGLILWIAEISEAILRKQAMGFGDVLLVGAIGTFCGWQGTVFAIFGGAVLGVVVGIPLMLTGVLKAKTLEELQAEDEAEEAAANETDESTENVEAKPKRVENEGDEEARPRGSLALPFGPMLAGAALIYFLWAHVYVDAYFAEMATIFFSNEPL